MNVAAGPAVLHQAKAGEAHLVEQLGQLPHQGWHVWHGLPLHNAGLDHLVVGPPGIFSIKTKNLSGRVRVLERAIYVNGRLTDYRRKALIESSWVAQRLRQLSHQHFEVTPLLVFIAEEVVVRQKPDRFTALAAHELQGWLTEQRRVLDEQAIRNVCTWVARWPRLPRSRPPVRVIKRS